MTFHVVGPPIQGFEGERIRLKIYLISQWLVFNSASTELQVRWRGNRPSDYRGVLRDSLPKRFLWAFVARQNLVLCPISDRCSRLELNPCPEWLPQPRSLTTRTQRAASGDRKASIKEPAKFTPFMGIIENCVPR